MRAMLGLVLLALVPLALAQDHAHGHSIDAHEPGHAPAPIEEIPRLFADPQRILLKANDEFDVTLRVTGGAPGLRVVLSAPASLSVPESIDIPVGSDRQGVATFVARATGDPGKGILTAALDARTWAVVEYEITAPPSIPAPAQRPPLAAIAAAGFLALAGALALYTRLRRERLAEHPARERLLALARAEPGVQWTDARDRLSLSNGQMAHHLAKLEKERLVFTSLDGRRRRIFPDARSLVHAERDALVRLLESEGPLKRAEAARRLGVSRQAVHERARRLLARRAIAVLPDGRLALAPR